MGRLVNPYTFGAGGGDVTPSNASWWDDIVAYSSSPSSPAPDPVSGLTNTVTLEGIDQTITLTATLSSFSKSGHTTATFWITKNGVLEGPVVTMTANGLLATFSVVVGDQITFSVQSDKTGTGATSHQILGTVTIANTSDGGATLDTFTFDAMGEVVI